MRQYLLLLSLLLPLYSQAQLSQTLRGRIVDKESKYPLVGATVQVTDVSLSSLTDTSGTYRIASVPVGRRTVRITLVGYKDVLLNNRTARLALSRRNAHELSHRSGGPPL